jgi:serine/threonine-protein kinase SRPK3
MKVLNAECYTDTCSIFELEILTRLREANPQHPGYQHIPTLIDSFEHQGPCGRHVCLVFEVMGESLGTFGLWFSNGQIPSRIMQRFTKQLLYAVDYAHQSGIIHTGEDLTFLIGLQRLIALQTLNRRTSWYESVTLRSLRII